MYPNLAQPSIGLILLKLLGFTIVIPGTVTVWLPLFVLFPGARRYPIPWNLWSLCSVALIAASVAGYCWCALDFAFAGRGTPSPIDPPKNLVVRGLYKYTRNPMYVSVLSILIGESLLLRSVGLFEYAVIGAILCHLFVVFYEEPALTRKMGDAYVRYCAQVPRWFLPVGGKRRANEV